MPEPTDDGIESIVEIVSDTPAWLIVGLLVVGTAAVLAIYLWSTNKPTTESNSDA